MREGTPIALPARSVRYAVCEAMGSAIPEGFRPEMPARAASAARANVPKGVSVDAVAADPAVFDTDAAPAYRDRVEHCRQSRLSPQPWTGERVWVNPPFSAMRAWVEKAWAAIRDEGAQTVVMLAPANRTEQRWWQESIEPFRDRGGALSVRFLPKRINFASQLNLGAYYTSSAPFGCVLLVWVRRAGAV